MNEPTPERHRHPQSTNALLIGVFSLLLCGLISPIAWKMGETIVREIDSSAGTLTGRGEAEAGRILGLVGMVLWSIGVITLIALKLFY